VRSAASCDGAATAEAFHVLIGRPKEALLALVPMTAFKDARELAEPVGCRHGRARFALTARNVDLGKFGHLNTLRGRVRGSATLVKAHGSDIRRTAQIWLHALLARVKSESVYGKPT
jgi:hypothetical protein